MGAKVGGKAGAESEINVTPLIDVVLVLLIIFMVLTPRVIEEMATNLPTKTETKKKPDEQNDQLVVALYDDNTVALNMKAMERPDLGRELQQRLRAKDQKVVFVDAHPDVTYDRVVEVMDIVRDAGAERVGLARLKDEGPARPSDAAPAAPAAPTP